MREVNPQRGKRAFNSSALARTLFQTFKLPPTQPLLVAYSGGLDSHVLLHALVQLRAGTGLRLRAIHVHHGLHADASRWEAHCRAVCAALGVELLTRRVTVPSASIKGLEAAAREARYRAFEHALLPDEVLCTAHHTDDQAETFLFRLMRGAGVHGLGAMTAKSQHGSMTLLRPLLTFTRAALRGYAEREGLRWIEDPSNADARFARNYIRANVLPLLQTRWPAAPVVIARAAEQMRAAAALVDEIGRADYAASHLADGALAVGALQGLTPLRRQNVLRHWFAINGFNAPSTRHLNEVMRLIAGAARGLVTWPEIEVRRYRDRLYVMPPVPQAATSFAAVWDFPRPLVLPALGCRLEALATHSGGIAAAAVQSHRVEVRLRQGGEYCRIAQRGHAFALKKLLQEAAIPPWERARLPLIYVDNRLAAIGAHWICAPFAADEDEPGYKIVQTALR